MRTFLGWRHPLRSLAEALLARGAGPWLDLHELAVVVPSARAGRRLLELLTLAAAQRGLALSPPRIVTSGRAPELFRLETARTPGDFTRTLAWVEALARTQPAATAAADRSPSPRQTPTAAFADRLDLAGAMDECLSALAAAGQDPSRAKDRLADAAVSCDLGFWDAFAGAYAAYREILGAWGCEEPHSARRLALEKGTLSCPGPVILAGVIEMPWALREMVRRFRERIDVFVFAPPERQDDFDELGGLIPRRWERTPAIPDEAVEFVEGPDEQAEAVVRMLHGDRGRYAADELVIGVPDEDVAALVERRLRRAGVPTRTPAGRTLGRGTVCRLLALVAEYLGERRFARLAALARHTDLAGHLQTLGLREDLPELLDAYQSEHLLDELPEPWPGEGVEATVLASFVGVLDRELRILREPAADRAAGWSRRIAAFLSRVYGERLLDPQDPQQAFLLEEAAAVGNALREWADLPEVGPELSANEALALLLRVLAGHPLPAPGDEPAVELLGWLELAMDDAPALAVTAMNEGVVPAASGASPVLPESVWRELGLPGDADRFARDNYILHVLLHSRERLRLIAARRTGDGHPLLPSRLLLQENADRAARRLLAFHAGPGERSGPAAGEALPGALVAGSECTFDPPPRPDPHRALPKSMSVTSFAAYLGCPYRYYLRHVLHLQAVDDSAREMDPLLFGSLAHAILQAFPKALPNGRGSQDTIRDCLLDSLGDELRKRFGTLSPRLRLQAEVLRRRLEAFAIWQAGWSAQGYAILHSELEFKPQDRKRWIEVDGSPMFIHGRIDRIDVRDDLSEAVVFDYKTSGKVQDPERSHFDGQKWIDLQLPLYRHLVEGLPGLPATRRLGYIALPADVAETGELIAPWTADRLAQADEAAREVVRGVRNRIFWPPARRPDRWTDEFADICRATRFVGFLEEEEESDEADA